MKINFVMRCGNKGNAIAFVNAGNKNILRPLLEQLAKEGLDIPQWLMDLNRRVNRYQILTFTLLIHSRL